MIVIVDYGMGNLKSVENSALFLGKKVKVSSSPAVISKAKKIIFPGVGHFSQAVKELKKRKLFDLLRRKIGEGIPFLGICLGMQLLLEKSQEAPGVGGLGIIEGEVKKFIGKGLIIPHMGWNQVEIKDEGKRIKEEGGSEKGEKLFRGIKGNSFFYFAHSYYCKPKKNKVVLTTTTYGGKFASALHKDNVWAVQFHPEKSQKLGLKVFNNFLKIC
ncbi:MAG: imidazole glycerol phosphate synthase subunit HisH [Candidatus Omnitrophica bacterium]|nr:imidazole glycerol phosphate synthase subunit HisH [Candidatus Omnitrophota bacterium]